MNNTIKPLKIALLSDPHIVETDDINYRQWQNALEKTKKLNPDLYLIAGDLTNTGSENGAKAFKKSTKGIDKPVLFVPGNHDIGNKRLEGKEGEISSQKVAKYREYFGPDFYGEKHHGFQIICLNSQLFQSGLEEEKAQLTFLKAQLALDCPKIILMHSPLYLLDKNEPGGNYWNAEPLARKEILDLIRETQVLAVLSGHMHKLIVNYADTLHLCCPPLSFGIPESYLGQSFVTLDVSLSNIHFELHHVESLYTKD